MEMKEISASFCKVYLYWEIGFLNKSNNGIDNLEKMFQKITTAKNSQEWTFLCLLQDCSIPTGLTSFEADAMVIL